MFVRKTARYLLNQFQKTILNQVRLARNRNLTGRRLEIGPGYRRISGFETLNIVGGRHVDYVWDASRDLPFADDTFEIIYASHILEHIPWYQVEGVVKDWVRVLKPDGLFELWVPDGLKICRTLIEYELTGENSIKKDGWYRFNPEKDPCVWAAGRIFTYGDGTGDPRHPNWHHALFTPRYLRLIMEKAGLRSLRELDRSEIRGDDHGWINLGMVGVKP